MRSFFSTSSRALLPFVIGLLVGCGADQAPTPSPSPTEKVVNVPAPAPVQVPVLPAADPAIKPAQFQPDSFSNSSPDLTAAQSSVILQPVEKIKAALAASQLELAKSLKIDHQVNERGELVELMDSSGKVNFNGETLAQFGPIPSLEELHINSYRLTNEDLEHLALFPNLTRLVLKARQLTDEGLIHLRQLRKLKDLILGDGKFTGTGVAHLHELPDFESLQLSSAAFDVTGLKEVATLRRLQGLFLFGGKIGDEDLRLLAGCPQLARLTLIDIPVSNRGVEILSEFKALEDLDLSHGPLTDACLENLLKLPKLREIEFGSGQVSAATVERLRAAKIEVRHGDLLSVRRDKDYLRYNNIDFEVNLKESMLHSIVMDGEPQWRLSIVCTEKFVPRYMQPPKHEIYFPGKLPWREMAGEEFKLEFPKDKLPIETYFGWGVATNHHHIRFVRRVGSRFQLEWSCEGKEAFIDEPLHPIVVSTEIAFRKFEIYSSQNFTLAEAKRQAAAHFDLADFEEPAINNRYDNKRAIFNIRADVK